MATTVDEILVSIKADMSSLQRDLRKLEKTNKGVGESFKRIGQIAAAALSGIGVAKIAQTTASFQDLQNSLNVVFKSAENGQAAMQFINDFAQRTPFDIQTLSKAMIQLGGAGIAPTEKMLETMGDAASVTTDKIGAFEAMTKLVTRSVGGGLGLEELEQLADRGIPVYQILTKELGLTRNEVSEFGKDAAGAKKLVDALFTGLDKEFGGAMQQGSKLLSTSLSNLGIAATDLMVTMGNALSPALIDLANQLQSMLNNSKPLANAIGSALGGAFKALGAILGFVGDHMRAILVATGTYLTLTLGSKGILAVAAAYRVLRGATLTVAAAQIFLNKQITKLGKTGMLALISGSAALIASIPQVSSVLDEMGKSMGFGSETAEDYGKSLAELEAQLATGISGPATTGPKSESIEGLKKLKQQLYEVQLVAEGYTKEAAKMMAADDAAGVSRFTSSKAAMEYRDILAEIAVQEETVARIQGAVDYAKQQTQLEKLTELELGLQEARAQNKITTEELEEANGRLQQQMKELDPAYVGVLDAVKQAGSGIADAFGNMVESGKFSLDSIKDIARQFIAQIIKMQLQLAIINPLINSMFGLSGTDSALPTGGIGTKKSAGGGSMHAGVPSIVGERGPELFIPHSAGTLLNGMNTKNALGGSSNQVVNNINVTTGVQNTVRAEIMNLLPAISNAVSTKIQDNQFRSGSLAG